MSLVHLVASQIPKLQLPVHLSSYHNSEGMAHTTDSLTRLPTVMSGFLETPSDSKNEPELGKGAVKSVPDGGMKAWATVAGGWFILCATFGYVYSFGVFQDFYTRVYLDESPSTIAWIGSFQLMMPFFLGAVSGKLFDAGHFHAVIIFGSTIFVFCLFMLSLAHPHDYYQIFLSQGVGLGIGIGFTFVPCIGVMVHHFSKHRAVAVGIMLTGGSVGSIVFPIMLNHLLPRIGFAQAVRASAYVVLGCLVIGNLLVSTGVAPQKKQPPNVKAFFKDPAFLAASFSGLLASFGIYFPVVYLQLYSVTHNIDPNLSFYALAIINASGAFGRVFGNYLADILGPFNMFVPCTLIAGGTILAVLGVHDVASLVVVSILYGFFSGAWLSLAMAALVTLARTRDEAGAIAGTCLAITSFGSLGSAPVQGALLTSGLHWSCPIAFSAAMVFVSSVGYGIARMLVARRYGRQRV